jgi:hypothetical protein
VIEDAHVRVTDYHRLRPGDAVVCDADPADPDVIDHIGIYVGRDASGGHRFISSRKTPNGPTITDAGGNSLLNGKGTYARSFRGARRF